MTKVMLIKDRNTFNTKWVCNFASQLSNRGYEVVLVSDSYAHSGTPVPIDEKVKKINLSAKTPNLLKNLWLIIRSFLPLEFVRYAQLFKQENPDVIICYFNRDLINATFRQSHNIPIIMMMHNPPNEMFANVSKGWRKYFTDKAFARAGVVQVLMNGFVKEVTDVYPDKKVEVIPNQVMEPKVFRNLEQESRVIIHVAQIARRAKRQHLLVEAFAKIAKDFPDWKVHFFGKVKKGKHQKYFNFLQAEIKRLGLEDRLIFKGYSNNITEEYLHSDIVTLPSFSEGFGYGLADGLAIGLPGIGFADAPAVNELIINNKSGYLVKDVDDYADKLAKLMSDKALRIKMGEFARQDIKQRYAPQKIIDKWVNLIERTKHHD